MNSRIFALRIISFFCIGCLITSCDQDELHKHQYSPVEIKDCYEMNEWTMETLMDSIKGRWKFEFEACPFLEGKKIEKKVTVDLLDNNTIILNEGGIQTKQYYWSIQATYEGYFRLETEPYLYFIQGAAVVCGNRLLIYENKITDYCEFFFNRIE